MDGILMEQFGVAANSIIQQKGGWAADAYAVYADNETYFLKVYDKARPSTERWTARIAQYTPILAELGDSVLFGKVPVPVPTLQGEWFCEDSRAIYLLYRYIDGETIGIREWSEHETAQLGDIIGKLHTARISGIPDELTEDFSIPFLDDLHTFACSQMAPEQYRKDLMRLVEKMTELKEKALQVQCPFVLCHTDIHGGNLMKTGNQLVLIDWEGLRYAPREADLFMVMDLPHISSFLSAYQHQCGISEFSETLLQFYHCRRKSEDIWEYAEQLLFEKMSERKRESVMEQLLTECDSLPKLLQETLR